MITAQSILNAVQDQLIDSINDLKTIHNISILAHNYQRPEIYKVADHVGDSLELAKKARNIEADRIIFCGVRFMAETAKILNPEMTVLLPEREATCSLAEMITLEELNVLKAKYPDAAVVCYINTSAEVKAASDICCTSSNALKVVNSLPNKRVIFIPDRNLGLHIQQQTDKELILWNGYCSVHTELDSTELLSFKRMHPGSKIVAHPECRPDILKAADHICSTSAMIDYARENQSSDFIIVTECGMINKLAEEVPEKFFYSLCNFCRYMKLTTLNSVLESILNIKNKIELPEDIMSRARLSVEKMMKVS